MKKKLKKILCCLTTGLMMLTASPQTGFITGITPCQVQAAQAVPSTPRLLSLKTQGKSTLILRWKAVPEATGYRIYRKTSDTKWKKVKDIFSQSQTSFTDTSVTFGEKYTYTVKAFIKKSGTLTWSSYNREGLSMVAGLNQLKLNRTNLELQTGQRYTLKLADTKQIPVWKSSSKNIAVVSTSGRVVAKNPGTAKITATLCGKIFTCTVTVQGSSVYNKYSAQYTKVRNYLKTKGTKDGSDWYVAYEDGHFGYYLICDNKTDGITLSCDYPVGNTEDVYSIVQLYIDCLHTYNSKVFMHLESNNMSMDTWASLDVRSSGKLTFYYSNGKKADSDVQNLGNTLFEVMLDGCNQVLKKTVKLSLKQLGVSYTA